MNAPTTRIIGFGQPAAGDDGAGIAVVRALQARSLPADADLHEITDPARLIELLTGIRHAILVDALVSNDTPGSIHCFTPDELVTKPAIPLSSHGIGITEVIGLARTLDPDAARCNVHIIGITIGPPAHYTHALSAPVAAALPRAANLISHILKEQKKP